MSRHFDGFRSWAAVLVGAAFMTGCLTGPGGGQLSFREGHYFLAGRFDFDYAYEQYFVALPDHRFEWVEYGYNAATSAVCKATRRKGTYVLADSSVRILVLEASEPLIKCGMAKSDFGAIRTTAIQDPKPEVYRLRGRDDDGFEAEGFFGAAGSWKHYPHRADPYGLYE